MIQLEGNRRVALDPRRRSLSERGAISNRKAAGAANAFGRSAGGEVGRSTQPVPFGAEMLPKPFPLGPSPLLTVRAVLAKTFSIRKLKSATLRTVRVRAPSPDVPGFQTESKPGWKCKPTVGGLPLFCNLRPLLLNNSRLESLSGMAQTRSKAGVRGLLKVS